MQKVGFWVLIAVLAAALLFMMKPFFEMVGLMVIGIFWMAFQLQPTEPGFMLFGLLALLLSALPLVWICRMLLRAYRHVVG